MLSAPELILALAIVFAGSTVMGLVGFGIGMVISPIMLLFIDPQSVVMIINSLAILLLTLALVQTRRDIPPVRDVIPLPIAGLVAIPLGVVILKLASPDAMRIIIASFILCLAVPSVFKIQRPLPYPNIMSPIFGFVGSLMVTGTGVGPPLVAVYLVHQRWTGRIIRASIAFYYLPIAIGAVILYTVTELFTLERVWTILSLAPAAFLGFGVASLLAKRINDRALSKMVLAVVVGSSLTLLGKEVATL